MKKIIGLSLTLAFLLSSVSMATFMQPATPASEEFPFRLGLGFQTQLVKRPLINPSPGFGIESMGGALSFSHNVGNDFEYGLAVYTGGMSYGHMFNKASTDAKLGMGYWGVDLMARYMPELVQDFHFGFVLNFGIDGVRNIYGKDKNPIFKAHEEGIAFGNLYVKLGPAMSYRFADCFALSFAPQVTLTKIRFYKEKAAPGLKDQKNYFGLEAPVAALFTFYDHLGVALEVNPMITRLNKLKADEKIIDYFALGFTFGLTYSF